MSVTAFVILYLTLGLAWAWHCAWVRQPLCEARAATPVLRVFRLIAWPVDALCDWAGAWSGARAETAERVLMGDGRDQ